MIAQQPTSKNMTIGPYIKIAGPPSVMASAIVAAMPAQLLQMIQLAEIVSNRVMGRAVGLLDTFRPIRQRT